MTAQTAAAARFARKAATAEHLSTAKGMEEGKAAALSMTAHALRNAEAVILSGEDAAEAYAMAVSALRALRNVYGVRLH